jgi:LysR family transcriptional regulator, cyn operon transcriptional activator
MIIIDRNDQQREAAIELRHLRYFVFLAETLNFTRAAERAHVTQSTLSHQIKQLEEQIGTPLFERVRKRVVMTESGEVFLAHITRALKEVDHGLAAIKRDPNTLTGLVRVGVLHTFNIHFIPACVANFLLRYPEVKVVVDELHADDILARLDAGSIDIGISYRPEEPTDLQFEALYNEELVLVVSPEHPFADRKRMRLVELHHQRLVLLQRGFCSRKLLEECFSACGAEPHVVAEMNTIAPMLGLVERTGIATIVPRCALPAVSNLRAVPIEHPTPVRTPGMLRKDHDIQSSPINCFATIVRKAALEGELRPLARPGRRNQVRPQLTRVAV